MNIRQQIACAFCLAEDGIKCDHEFENNFPPCMTALTKSRRLLSIPDIKEGLSLLEMKRLNKLPISNLNIYPDTKGGRKASKYRLAGRNDVIDWINREIINQYVSSDDIVYRKWVDKLQEWSI